MTLRVRALGDDEGGELARMARSRTLGAGLVRRAQIVRHAVEEGLSAPDIAARMGLYGATVRFWLKRFNERGLAGLEEDMRSGRPPPYSSDCTSTRAAFARGLVVIIARSRSALVIPHHRAALCNVCLFTAGDHRSTSLRSTQRDHTALPSAHRTLSDAYEYPCERRRPSPTWLHPQS